MSWGTTEEVERRNRIRLSIWAYAYEILDDPLVSDAAFDELSLKINPNVSTGHKKLDAFFREEFDPSTGMWVNKHPDPRGLFRAYMRTRGFHKEKSINVPA